MSRTGSRRKEASWQPCRMFKPVRYPHAEVRPRPRAEGASKGVSQQTRFILMDASRAALRPPQHEDTGRDDIFQSHHELAELDLVDTDKPVIDEVENERRGQ